MHKNTQPLGTVACDVEKVSQERKAGRTANLAASENQYRARGTAFPFLKCKSRYVIGHELIMSFSYS